MTNPHVFAILQFLPNPGVKVPYPGDLLCFSFSMISSVATSIFVRTDLPTGICSRISHVPHVLHALKKVTVIEVISHKNKIPELQFRITGLHYKVSFLFLHSSYHAVLLNL